MAMTADGRANIMAECDLKDDDDIFSHVTWQEVA